MKRFLTLAVLMAVIGLGGQSLYGQNLTGTYNVTGTTSNTSSTPGVLPAPGTMSMNNDGNDTASLQLDAATTLNFRANIANNANAFALAGNTLTLNANGYTVNLNGAITGTGNLTIGSGGVITLGGANDISGVFTANGKTTLVSDFEAGSTVVGSTGYLYLDGGTVNLTGNTRANSGGVIDGKGSLHPTDNALTTNPTINGNLTLDANSSFIGYAGLSASAGTPTVGYYGTKVDGTIIVDQGAKTYINFDQADYSGLTTAGQLSFNVGVNANDEWVDTDLATASLRQNAFYRLSAQNTAATNGIAQIAMLRTATANTEISNMYAMGTTFHHYRTIYDATSDRMTQNFAYRGKKGSSCGTGCEVDFDPTCGTGCGWTRDYGKSAWVNFTARSDDSMQTGLVYDNDMEFKSYGVQLGLDLYSASRTQFGVMFGYEKGKLTGDGYGSKLEADDIYFGLYGGHVFCNGFDIRGVLGYGHQDFDMNRTTFQQESYFSSFDSNTFEASVELGRRMYVNRCFSFRPVVGFDFYYVDQEEAKESGYYMPGAVNYAGIDYSQIFARFGSDVQWTRNRFNINGGLYYSYQLNNDGETSGTTVTSDTFLNERRDLSYELGNSVLTLKAGTNYYFNKKKTLAVYANYYGDCFLDRDGDPWTHTGVVGLQWQY